MDEEGSPRSPEPQTSSARQYHRRQPGLGGSARAPGSTAAVGFHRTLPWRRAYLLTMPVLLALTIVLADQLARVLPAWS